MVYGEPDALVKRIEETLSVGALDGSRSDKLLEDLAHEVSLSEPETARRSVESTVASIVSHTSSSLGCQFLAWLLVYGIVEPLQVLQAIIYTRDTSMLRICGTAEMNDDVIEYLRLDPCKALIPGFDSRYVGPKILVDLLSSTPRAPVNGPRKAPEPYEPAVNSTTTNTYGTPSEEPQTKPAASRAEHAMRLAPGYELQLRKILRASMSAEEAAHKLLGVYAKGTEDMVVKSILQVCHDSKVYNRFFGNLSTRLSRHNQRLFGDALARGFSDFFQNCEQLGVDELRVCGQYFGHLLSTDALGWHALRAASLAPDASSPSNRILLVAIFEELKASMGVSAVETKIFGVIQGLDGLFKPELAIGFWDLAGFARLSDTACELSCADSSA